MRQYIWAVIIFCVRFITFAGLPAFLFPFPKTAEAAITVEPSSWDYGMIQLKTTAATIFTVRNSGPSDVYILSVCFATSDPLPFPYAISGNDNCSGKTVAAAGDCSFDLGFTPGANGPAPETLMFLTSSDPDSPMVSLSGYGIHTPLPYPGIISWWPGDSDASDIISGYNGTYGGLYQDGMAGEAFGLDGMSTNIVALPDGMIAAAARNFTVEAWVYPFDVSGTHSVFHAGSATGGEFLLSAESDSFKFGVLIDDGSGGGTWYEVSAPAYADQWAHIAGLRRGTGIELWVNGALAATEMVPDSDLLTAAGYSPAIGGYRTSDNMVITEQWNGLIDEVKLYGVALSLAEIQSIHRTMSVRLVSYEAESFFSELQDAVNAVTDTDQIEAREMSFGSLTVSKQNGVKFSLHGGFVAGFGSSPGYTTIEGSLAVSSGTISVDKIIIK